MQKLMILPLDVEEIIFHLNHCGYDAYAVGGCVRDSLLGITPSDWDICTSATPEQIKECFLGYDVLETGLRHGTVTLRYKNRSYEITTFRQDGEYFDSRRPSSVRFVTNIRDDLSRRDFTINAMAYHPVEGLVDCYGGVSDLQQKRICCVGDAKIRFSEDALRIMRALRFAAVYSFQIESATKNAVFELKQHLKNIAAERICEELRKLITADGCDSVLSEYRAVFEVIIPELYFLHETAQKNNTEIFDLWEHTVRAVSNAPKELTVRMALLLSRISYETNAITGEQRAELCGKALSYLRFEKQLIHNVKELVLSFNQEIHPTQYCVKLWLNRLGAAQFERLLQMKEADLNAFDDAGDKISELKLLKSILGDILSKNACYSIPQLAVTGTDLIFEGISEGPLVGEMLQMLLEQVLENRLENKKEVLLAFVEQQQKRG